MTNKTWLLLVVVSLSLTVFLLNLESLSVEIICSEESVEEAAKSRVLARGTRYENPFQIHVLAWNRPASLKRLLDSLSVSAYDGDEVDLIIHIDGGRGTKETEEIACNLQWSHGRKEKIKSKTNRGLAVAWFNAWTPKSSNERAIIFEDDIVVSPLWYMWLKKAWQAYINTSDVAGISLMRQTFVPKQKEPVKSWSMEIVNNHEPFLFKLVGSIGFSPHPDHWKRFIDWIHSVDYKTVNVFVPGLITSRWWKEQSGWWKGRASRMWTQHFIYFCNKYELYTLYINLPNGKTLVANMRESGVHSARTQGPDFPLATNVSFHFPKELNRYNWAGKLWPIYAEEMTNV